MAKVKRNYFTEEETFTSHFEEETHIFVKHYLPLNYSSNDSKDKKYIHLLFQHGMIEYHLRHEEFFEYLLNTFKGEIIISVMDLLGHGFSGGHRAYVDKFETFCFDMIRFFEVCDHKFPAKKIKQRVLGSHSLGGLITLRSVMSESYALPFEIDQLVFINPCVSPKVEVPGFTLKMIEKIPPLLRRVRVPLIYDAYDLSSDKEKAISFMHDHLISKSVTVKLAIETKKATDNINSYSYFCKIPSFFVLSGKDVVVDNEKTSLFITGMDKKLVKVKHYPKMKHDILNETCRIDVFKEIISYIQSFNLEKDS